MFNVINGLIVSTWRHKTIWNIKFQTIGTWRRNLFYYFNEASRQIPPRPRALCLNDQNHNKLKQQSLSLKKWCLWCVKHWFRNHRKFHMFFHDFHTKLHLPYIVSSSFSLFLIFICPSFNKMQHVLCSIFKILNMFFFHPFKCSMFCVKKKSGSK